MFYNPMQLPEMASLSSCGGYYHHELVRTPDGWRSRRLREENVWFLNAPAEAANPHVKMPTYRATTPDLSDVRATVRQWKPGTFCGA
jgi:hypothetical protein